MFLRSVPLLRCLHALLLVSLLPAMRAAVGDVDGTFSAGSGVDGVITTIVPLPSGQILVGGLFTHYNGVTARGLARVNPDGSLDASFAPAIEMPAQGGVATLLLDRSGRIYVGGLFNRVGGTDRPGLARLTASGAVDPGFVPALAAGVTVASLALSPDESSLFVGGYLGTAQSGTSTIALSLQKLRTSDGGGAPDFTAPAMTAYDGIPIVYKILPLADGRLLIGGEFNSANGLQRLNLCRVRTDGSVDPSFTIGTPLAWTQVNDLDMDASGRIYISGDFVQIDDYTTGSIARLTASGTIDRTFQFPTTSTTSSSRSIVNNLHLLADGRLLAVGQFARVGDTPRNHIVRAFDDGTIDASFPTGADQEVVAVAEDDAGRILVGGYFGTINNATAKNLARLTRTGDGPVIRSQPAARSVLQGENAVVRPTIVGADSVQWYRAGQPLEGATGIPLAIASARTSEAGTYTFRASNRFGTTVSEAIAIDVVSATAGSRDPDFDVNREPFNLDGAIAHLPDDTWLAVQNGTVPKLLRYDAAFNKTSTTAITGFTRVSATQAAVDTGGRIWIAGEFTLPTGSKPRLVRLTSDGIYDSSFQSSEGEVYKFQVLADGSVLVLGQSLVKLRPNGARDETFPPQSAICFAVQSDGRILCNSILPFSQLGLIRLNADGSPDTSFVAPTINGIGRREKEWPMTEVRDVAVASSGQIVVTTRGLLNYAALVRLAQDGSLISNLPVTRVEGNQATIAAVDRENGAIVQCAGLTHYAPDGVSQLLVAPVASPVTGSWRSSAQGIVLKCAIGNSIPPEASSFTFLRALDHGAGEAQVAALSGRGVVGDGDSSLIVGFVTQGASGRVLVRGVGPELRNQGVSLPQEDLSLSLHRGLDVLQENDDWSSDLAPVFRQVGAVDLSAGSHDAALAPTLAGGVYTAVLHPISPAGGIGLGEVYDASGGSLELTSVSIRGHVAAGEQVLIGGVVVTGSSPSWFLIRALGPSLSALGVNQPLPNPTLTLVRDSAVAATNDDWSSAEGDQPALSAAAARKVGAPALAANSKDAVVYVRLFPGIYTAIAASADGAEGAVLLEMHRLPTD